MEATAFTKCTCKPFNQINRTLSIPELLLVIIKTVFLLMVTVANVIVMVMVVLIFIVVAR